jgi:hypothetical protein
MLGLWLNDMDVYRHHLRFLFGFRSVSEADRAAVRQFFAHRKTERERYFLIANEPCWGYAAGAFMLMNYTWDSVVWHLTKSPVQMRLLKNLGIRYVVYPRAAIPREVLAQLDRDVLVSVGDNHFRLGMVHRGEDVFIFKITDGIASRTTVFSGDPARDMPAAVAVGDAFQPWAAGQSRPDEVASDDDGRGVLAWGPLQPQADAVVFKMGGVARDDRVRIELEEFGEALYHGRPANSETPRYFALDTGASTDGALFLRVLDACMTPQCSIAVSDVQLVTYSDPLG